MLTTISRRKFGSGVLTTKSMIFFGHVMTTGSTLLIGSARFFFRKDVLLQCLTTLFLQEDLIQVEVEICGEESVISWKLVRLCMMITVQSLLINTIKFILLFLAE